MRCPPGGTGLNRPWAFWTLAALLFGGTFLLFTNLGSYALWDDEAGTALHATAVSKTGDTGAVVGENLVAFRSGVALQNLKDRTVSPLQYYLAAPFVALSERSSFFARLPFALSGFLALLLAVSWMWKSCQNGSEVVIYSAVTLSCIPLFLYFRQCRYYSLVLLFVLLTLFLYLKKPKTGKLFLCLNLSLWGLMASHYLGYFSVVGALGIDYLLWGRKDNPFSRQQLVCLGLLQIVFAALIMSIWNPLGTNWGAQLQDHGLSPTQRVILFIWQLRDCFRSEFLVCILFLASPLIAAKKRDVLLARAFVAVILILLFTAAASPQTFLGSTGTADIRYVISILPLGIFISGRVILDLAGGRKLWLALGVFGFCFLNLLNPFRLDRGQGPSTFTGFFREILGPPNDPYRVASNWISLHAPNRSSIWVLPDYACYPLMFHAPNGIYAWQLRPEQKQEEQFKNLPDIHFQGLVPPDFIVVFGPSVEQVRQLIGQWSMQGLRYQEVTRLMTFWKDLYRPELFWRTFKPIENFDPNTEAIYIFKRQP